MSQQHILPYKISDILHGVVLYLHDIVHINHGRVLQRVTYLVNYICFICRICPILLHLKKITLMRYYLSEFRQTFGKLLPFRFINTFHYIFDSLYCVLVRYLRKMSLRSKNIFFHITFCYIA